MRRIRQKILRRGFSGELEPPLCANPEKRITFAEYFSRHAARVWPEYRRFKRIIMKNFKNDSTSTLARFGRDQRTRTSSTTAERVERRPRLQREAGDADSAAQPARRASFNPNFTRDNRPVGRPASVAPVATNPATARTTSLVTEPGNTRPAAKAASRPRSAAMVTNRASAETAPFRRRQAPLRRERQASLRGREIHAPRRKRPAG